MNISSDEEQPGPENRSRGMRTRSALFLVIGLGFIILLVLGIVFTIQILELRNTMDGTNESGDKLSPADATATSVCQEYQQKFPATPCPLE